MFENALLVSNNVAQPWFYKVAYQETWSKESYAFAEMFILPAAVNMVKIMLGEKGNQLFEVPFSNKKLERGLMI